MDRAPGPSARLKLTLSYAGFLVVAGALLLAAALLSPVFAVPGLAEAFALGDESLPGASLFAEAGGAVELEELLLLAAVPAGFWLSASVAITAHATSRTRITVFRITGTSPL